MSQVLTIVGLVMVNGESQTFYSLTFTWFIIIWHHLNVITRFTPSQCHPTQKSNHDIKVKHGTCIFSHHCNNGTLFVYVVSRGAAAVASPNSVWGLKYQPWHGWWLVCKWWIKKLNHNINEKMEVDFSHLVLAAPVCFCCWKWGSSSGITRLSLGAEIAGVE